MGQNRVAIGEEQMYDMAELFKVFSDSTRIRILLSLLQSVCCVNELVQRLGMTQPAISYQLRILKQAKLVRATRMGKQMLYALADDHVETIIRMAREHLEENI